VTSTSKSKAIILSLFLLAWISVLSVDNYRAEHQKAPLFCVEVETYDDGSVQYIGLFYQVYHVVHLDQSPEPMTIDYGYYVVPWFVTLHYVKHMLEITTIT
jgi:hypothetical protein